MSQLCKDSINKKQFCANTVLCHSIGVSYVWKTNYLTRKIIENISLEMDFLSTFSTRVCEVQMSSI